jgi:hypothetical protein
MKKLTIFIFLLIGMINTVYCQSVVHDLMSSRPDYKDTINEIDRSFKKCDSTWRTNPEWSECLLTHLDMWEVYMKKTYDTLLSVLDSTGQSLLKQSQKYWKKSNEAEDKFSNYIIIDVGNNYFGRDGDFERFYSDINEVKERAMELKSCLIIVREMKEARIHKLK